MAGTNEVGLVGLAVMGQNLALNIAEKGFPIGVYNRTVSKVDETVQRAQHEGRLPLTGYHDIGSFVQARRAAGAQQHRGGPVNRGAARCSR